MRDDRPEALTRPEAADAPAPAGAPAPADAPAQAPADWPRRNDSQSPAELSRRLDSLPDGHPSSRYEADGTLRQAPVRLSDLETAPTEDETGLDNDGLDATPDAASPADAIGPADQKRLITDAEWAEHVTDVRETLDKAQRNGFSTDRQHTIDPSRSVWSAERDLIHDTIIGDLYWKSRDVPCDHKAIMAGGLGGSGKTTILSRYAGADLSQYLTINPDEIKEEIAIRGLIPDIDGLTPMEASDLVHEESSHIAKRLARRAEAEGKNVVWDITMSSRDSTESRIGTLRAEGYSVDGIFVDIAVETSIRRADARHREGHSEYLAGFGLGGRYVPPEVIEAQADPEWGSKNRRTFEEIHQLFDHWARYDNSVDGRPPVLTQTDSSIDRNR